MDDQNVKALLRQAADEVPATNVAHMEQIRQAIAQTVCPKPSKRGRALLLAASGALGLAVLLIMKQPSPEPLLPPSPPHSVQYIPLPAVISPYPDPLAGIVIWPEEGK